MYRLQERRAVSPLSADAPRPPRRWRARALAFGVAAVVVAVDQLTKSFAVAGLSHGPVHLLGPFSLALAYNSGVAFSIGTGLVLPIVLAVIALLGIVLYFGRSAPGHLGSVATGLILGGAVGNLSDRLFRHDGGAVVDFIYTRFWPTFNVADACIVIGSALLILVLLRANRPSSAPR